MISHKELRSLKVQFGMWLGLTKEARQSAGLPIDQDEYAEKIGVTPKTLCQWKKIKDPLVLESRDNAKKLFLEHARFGVYKALIDSAQDIKSPKSAQDRRTFFQVTGDLSKEKDKGSGEKHTVEIVIKDEFRDKDNPILPSASGVPKE